MGNWGVPFSLFCPFLGPWTPHTGGPLISESPLMRNSPLSRPAKRGGHSSLSLYVVLPVKALPSRAPRRGRLLAD